MRLRFAKKFINKTLMLVHKISTAKCISIFINFPTGKQKLCMWLTDEKFNVTRIGISSKKDTGYSSL